MCGGFVISGIGHPFRVRSSDTGADVSTASWSNLHYIQSPYHSGKSTGAVAVPASYCGLYSARDAALADSSCITSSSREKCRGMLHWPSKSSLKELSPSLTPKSTKNVSRLKDQVRLVPNEKYFCRFPSANFSDFYNKEQQSMPAYPSSFLSLWTSSSVYAKINAH